MNINAPKTPDSREIEFASAGGAVGALQQDMRRESFVHFCERKAFDVMTSIRDNAGYVAGRTRELLFPHGGLKAANTVLYGATRLPFEVMKLLRSPVGGAIDGYQSFNDQ